MEKIFEKIIEKIDKGEEISPFLFIDKNTEILNEKVKSLALDLLKNYGIPKEFLFILEKNEKIKTDEVRAFANKANLWTPFKIQIFLFENFWNLNQSSSNTLLKFFEEPWVKNLIFLTNESENNILDTILSRVQTINFSGISKNKKSEFYYDLIKNYLRWETELLAYFYKTKLEKEDYLEFLENLIIYAKENLVFIEFLDEILEDMQAIKKNNVNAKNIVDKWIFKI